jgi:Uma2 family endonuclease
MAKAEQSPSGGKVMALLERITVERAKPLRSVEDIPPGTRYVPERLLTVDEFYEMISEDSRAELDEGAIVMPSPAGFWHEDCFGFLFFLLRGFVDARRLGVVLGSRSKVRLGQRIAREPDILFVAESRRELVQRLDVSGGPDLVVEIINSDKGRSEALAKVHQYRNAGVAELWLVDLPARRVIQMLLVGGEYDETILAGEAVLAASTIAGFRLPVALLFSAPGEYPPAYGILQRLLSEEAGP